MRNKGAANRAVSLTEAQAIFVRVVEALGHAKGVPPSYEELMVELSLSKTLIRDRALLLCDRGYLSRITGGHRSLRVTPKGKRAIRVAAKKAAR